MHELGELKLHSDTSKKLRPKETKNMLKNLGGTQPFF